MTPTRSLIRAAGLALGLATLFAGPTLGAHHLESEKAEPAPKPAKIIVIAPDEFIALVGTKRTFWATICNEDGSGCKDAKKAKWSVVPNKGLKLGKKKGMQVLTEGLRAGTYELTAKQNGVSGTAKVKINEPPSREPEPEEPAIRLRLDPELSTLRIGEIGTFTAWGCPSGVVPGADGAAAGCEPVDITALNPDESLPLEVWGPLGNAFAVMPTAFPEGVEGDFAFLGSQVQTELGGTLPELEVENAPFEGTLRTDVDGDGDVDVDDLAALAVDAPIAAGDSAYEARLDVNRDFVIDDEDAAFLKLLAPELADESAEEADTGGAAEDEVAEDDPADA